MPLQTQNASYVKAVTDCPMQDPLSIQRNVILRQMWLVREGVPAPLTYELERILARAFDDADGNSNVEKKNKIHLFHLRWMPRTVVKVQV